MQYLNPWMESRGIRKVLCRNNGFGFGYTTTKFGSISGCSGRDWMKIKPQPHSWPGVVLTAVGRRAAVVVVGLLKWLMLKCRRWADWLEMVQFAHHRTTFIPTVLQSLNSPAKPFFTRPCINAEWSSPLALFLGNCHCILHLNCLSVISLWSL